jgi:hypothetical protein
MSSGYQQPQWSVPPPPPGPPKQRNTGLIVSSVAFGVMLIVFVVTAFVVPGFLVSGDSGTADPAPPASSASTEPSASSEPSEPAESPTPSVPMSSTGIEQDPAYMKPMEAFVTKVNARNAAAANAMTCKDSKSQRLTIPRVNATVKQGPHYVIEYGNSGKSVMNLAGLELGGKLGNRTVPKVPAAGNESHLIYTGGVSARLDSSGWCINAFYSGFSDIDGS